MLAYLLRFGLYASGSDNEDLLDVRSEIGLSRADGFSSTLYKYRLI